MISFLDTRSRHRWECLGYDDGAGVDGCHVGRAWLLCLDVAGLARPGDLRCSGCASLDEGVSLTGGSGHAKKRKGEKSLAGG
jgi:hypothetical protein